MSNLSTILYVTGADGVNRRLALNIDPGVLQDNPNTMSVQLAPNGQIYGRSGASLPFAPTAAIATQATRQQIGEQNNHSIAF